MVSNRFKCFKALTRNQAYRKVPWVRIPLSPPINTRKAHYQYGIGLFSLVCFYRLFTDCGTGFSANTAPALDMEKTTNCIEQCMRPANTY